MPNAMPHAAAARTMQMIVVTVVALLVATPGRAQTAGAAALAAAVSNPVAAMISVTIQFNYDKNIGPDRAGDRWTINAQPVIPFTLNENWNLISRTIAPIVVQDEIFPGAGRQTGLGDVAQSLFFSPRKPTEGGWIWGAGPVFLLPTATDDYLGTKKCGAGPTGVFLKQEHGWTVGALFNHIWSFAGDESRPDINQSFLQRRRVQFLVAWIESEVRDCRGQVVRQWRQPSAGRGAKHTLRCRHGVLGQTQDLGRRRPIRWPRY